MDPPVIETRGLTKLYGPTVGVKDLDLRIGAGEVFGFLGPNGSGKSTTIRLLLGLIRPTAGEALVFGKKAREPRARRRVGYVPGDLVLDGRMTGRGNLDFLAALGAPSGSSAASRRDEVCERLGLSPEDLSRRVREYSRGMRQKLGLVAALQHDPDLLVLDEPTTALDPLVRDALFDLLLDAARRGTTVFQSSHVLSEVERTCSRIAILRRGRLVSVAGVDEIRRSSARRMVVRFAVPIQPSTLALDGVEIVEGDGQRFVLSIRGSLEPVLGLLARHGVVDLSVPEPSLEEAFVELYRDPGGGE